MHYVCSDIHGRWDRYRKLYEEVPVKPEDTLYILGDVIDRGPDGIKILMDVMDRPEVVFLLGNHELFLYTIFHDLIEVGSHGSDGEDRWLEDIENMFRWWMENGGEPTLRSYMELENVQQERILSYLADSYVAIPDLKVGGARFYLVHGSPSLACMEEPVRCRDFAAGNHRKEWNKKTLRHMVWEGMERGEQYTLCPPGKKAVVGHVITTRFSPCSCNENGRPRIHFDQHFIGIDCGCAMKGEQGCLGVLRLEDRKEFYL